MAITRSRRKPGYRKREEPKFKKVMRCAVFVGVSGEDAVQIGSINEAPPKTDPAYHAERQWIDQSGNMDKLRRVLQDNHKRNADQQIEIDLSDEICPTCAVRVYPTLRTRITSWLGDKGSLPIYVFLGREDFKLCYVISASGVHGGLVPCMKQ